MKTKVSLLSLLTVLAISSAAEAHIENPLYLPRNGQLYSSTDVSYSDKNWEFAETIGYGITNKLSINGTVDYEWNDAGEDGFGNFEIGTKYRILTGEIKTDLYASYATDIDEDVVGNFNEYNIGTRFGIMKNKYTLAGKVGYQYIDFKDYDIKMNNIIFGADALYNFDDRVSGQLGIEYAVNDDDDISIEDSCLLTAQLNYLKGGLWSIYYKTELKADDVEDTFGLKYGIQF